MKSPFRAFALLVASAGLCGLAACPAAASARAVPAASSPDSSGIGLRPGGPEVLAAPALFSRALKSPDWVRTPDGLLYRTCVHHVPRGSVYDAVRDQITGPRGATTRFAACAYPRLLPANAASGPAARPASHLPFNGWQQDSWWTEKDTWSSDLLSTYATPTAPSSPGGATDYLFSSFENNGSIIQPVIGYGPTDGADGGSFLWEQSYYVNGNNAAVGANHPISAGDTITGWMDATGCQDNGGDCTWDIVTYDHNSGQKSGVSIKADSSPYNTVQGGVLEAYGVNHCDQLFGSGAASFSGIAVASENVGIARPDFRPTPPQRECGLNTTASPDSTTISWNPSS